MNELPGRRTQAYEILSLIAITGELPTALIGRLRGGSRYKECLVGELKKTGLVVSHYKDKLRGLRLTVKAKELLLTDNPVRFGSFLSGSTETNIIKSEIPRRLRLHRVAEAYVTMLNSGVSVFRGDKPDLFSADKVGRFTVASPAFYGSREVKVMGADMTAAHNSRAVGALVTAETVFAVYNTGDSLMKWDYKPELRLRALLLHKICRERLTGERAVRALMLGADMDAAVTLMTSKKRNYFALDSFESFCFIPNNRYGETLLRLLCDAALSSELTALLSDNLSPPQPGALVENDAMDGATPVLFAYLFDMPRIMRFCSALRLHVRRGIAVCFDFQSDALTSVCGDRFDIQTIDFEKFRRRFFDED